MPACLRLSAAHQMLCVRGYRRRRDRVNCSGEHQVGSTERCMLPGEGGRRSRDSFDPDVKTRRGLDSKLVRAR